MDSDKFITIDSPFDPEVDAPQTDEQVEIALRHIGTEESTPLLGIYRIRRNEGDSILDAYEYALLAYVEAARQNRRVRNERAGLHPAEHT